MSEKTMPKPETGKPKAEITRAVPEDAEAIMRIRREGWMNTYVSEEHDITADDMSRIFSDEAFAAGVENWREGIAADAYTTRRATFVARIDGEVVGFTSPRVMEDGERRIGAMYVGKAAQGSGVGGALLTTALDWHGPDEDVYLHVVSYNEKAIGFYKHFGFVETGVATQRVLDKQHAVKTLSETEMVRRADSN
jgi:RimJ/RimL family protein N-acetyltransferase